MHSKIQIYTYVHLSLALFTVLISGECTGNPVHCEEDAFMGNEKGDLCWNINLTPVAHKSPLQWRHNGLDSVSNHQRNDSLLNRLFRRRSKQTSKLRVTGLCAGNSPVPGEFPAQMASIAENVSIWWRHHDNLLTQPQRQGICSVPSNGLKPVNTYCIFDTYEHTSMKFI